MDVPDIKAGEWHPSQWWKPGQSDVWKVPGTYELLDNGRAKINLFKNIDKDHSKLFPSDDDSHIPLLHGDCFGKAVTLLSSNRTRYRGNLGELCSATYLPWLALEGLFLAEDELTVSDAILTLHDQQIWAQRTAFQPEYDHSDRPYFPSAVRHIDIPDCIAETSGGKIVIEERSVYHPGKSAIKLESRCVFKIALDSPVSIKELMESWIYPLEVLMATASGRIGGIESLKITNRKWIFERDVPASSRWATVRVAHRAGNVEQRKDLHFFDLLFSLIDIDWPHQGPALFETIPKWSYVIEQWAMLLTPDYKWPVARFVSAVQAVEALDRLLVPDVQDSAVATMIDEAMTVLKEAGFNHRKRRRILAHLRHLGTPSLENRIERRVSEMPLVMSSLTADTRWPARVARLRNIVSHGLEDSHNRERVVMSSLVATDLLMHVLEATFLLNLGFTQEKTDEIMKRRSSFSWRAERINDGMQWLPKV